MSGAIEPVDWHQSADELHERYRAERNLEVRKRLGALWLVRQGESVSAAAESMGVGRRTLTRWLSWYREGGLQEVLSRVPGHGALGHLPTGPRAWPSSEPSECSCRATAPSSIPPRGSSKRCAAAWRGRSTRAFMTSERKPKATSKSLRPTLSGSRACAAGDGLHLSYLALP